MRRVLLVVLLAGCDLDLTPGDLTSPTGEFTTGKACDPAIEPCTISHQFPARVIAPSEEDESQCMSWTMHNPTELWVSAVEFSSPAGGFHHSNWLYVPDTEYNLPDGMWNCDENGWSELVAALLGGFLFIQSGSLNDEKLEFHPGAAVRIPPYSRIIASTHMLNYTDQPLTTDATITIRSMPVSAVNVKLVPFQLSYHDLHLAAGSISNFFTTCDVASEYQTRIGEPMQFELYHVMSHYHSLGTAFRISIAGGSQDGSQIFERIGEAAGDSFWQNFDPPIQLADMAGITFGCTYDNPRAEEIGWGIGDQEMCLLTGFADTKMAFAGEVLDGTGSVVGTTDGVVQNTGPCALTGFPWYHDRPGGVGP